MILLSDQSKVICSLQKTIEDLNITVKSLNEEILKMKQNVHEVDTYSDSNSNSNLKIVHLETVHENIQGTENTGNTTGNTLL